MTASDAQQPIQLQGAASPQGAMLDVEAAKPVASNGPDERTCTCHPDDLPPLPCPRKYALSECRDAALMRQAAEALECNAMWAEGSEAHPRLLSIAAALRQRIGRE